MSAGTKIEWTDATFNPWWGCTKISPGCDHCYAERDAHRFGTEWGPDAQRRTFGDKHWNEPRRWNARRARQLEEVAAIGETEPGAVPPFRVFCASMADVFDNAAPGGQRDRLWNLIRETPHLTWQILTKRIGNARGMLPADWGSGWPNVWLGATIVNQTEADRDIPKLIHTPARIRFLSCEPLLGPVYLNPSAFLSCPNAENAMMDPTTGAYECCSKCDFTGVGDEMGVDWVIAGGESGPNARPMHPDWPRLLRDDCAVSGVPFLFKQWGEWAPRELCGAPMMLRVGKRFAGRLLDGVQHDAYPVTP